MIRGQKITADLITEIRRLEEASQALEPRPEVRRELLEKVGAYTEQFLTAVPEQPAYLETEDMGAGLEKYPIGGSPLDIDTVIGLYRKNVDIPGSHPSSPRHLAYIPACANYYSALGDYLAALSNPYSGTYFAGPGAVRMENLVLSWIGKLVGYPESAAGNLTSGGSLANLTGIVTAREAHGLKPEDYRSAVVYVTEHTHHCIDKALHLIGMGECVKRFVGIDENGRMSPTSLDTAIAGDQQGGLRPWLVIASAGSTNLGGVDPLAAIGEVARRHRLWYHVDAAYGGFFLLSDVVKHLFAGIELSDSVVLDPHKSLYIPFGTGAVLVRDGAKLYDAHFHTADYLQDAYLPEQPGSPSDLGPELTRHFRAARIWLPLMLLGLRPFEASLTEKILLSRYAYQKMDGVEGIELGPFPELSIFVFRFLPASGDPDEFNAKLIEQLRLDGRVFLSSTVVGDAYMIRFPLLSFRTHLETVDTAIGIICEQAARLAASV